MAYADYPFYRDEYQGREIAEEDFPRLIDRASAYLDYVTAGRAGMEDEMVGRAACAAAEVWQRNEQGGELQSQSVGSWSQTYTSGGAKTKEQRLWDAVKLYLEPAGLLGAAAWI